MASMKKKKQPEVGRPEPSSVYDAYEAVEACYEAFLRCRGVVEQAMKARETGITPEKFHLVVEEAFDDLRGTAMAAESKLEPLKRDLHRARVEHGTVAWVSVTAASWAEAIVAQAMLILQETWNAERLLDPEGGAPVGLLNASGKLMHRMKAELHIEAARVAKERENKRPDLGRFTDSERRVYAALLLHGAMPEKALAKLVHRSPGGGFRGDLRAMVRHGILDHVADGYEVRRR